MKTRIKAISVENIILALMFMFAISLFNLAGYIFAGILVLYLLFVSKKQIAVNIQLVVLAMFSVTYFINYSFYWDFGIKEIIIYLIAPWGSYLLGSNLVMYSKDERFFHKLLFILAAGFFAHGVLNLIAYFIEYGFGFAYRLSVDFWRNEEISVTGCSLFYVPLMSLSVGYLFFGKKGLLKFAGFLVICVSLVANITYANRTALFLLAILVAFALGSILLKKKANVKAWIIVGIVVAAVSVIWIYDIFGVKTAINALAVTQRIVSGETGRLSIWIEFLKSNWWRYPFGGEHIVLSHGYAHNMWLDVMNAVGFAPFVLLMIFSIQAFGTVISFYKKYKSEIIYVYMMFGIVISCFVEPIILCNPYYFMSLVMIIGGINGYLYRKSMVE